MSADHEQRPILDARFRSNPAYQLVLIDRLPHHFREQFQNLVSDPDVYSLLWPNEEVGLPPKAVGHDTALLFLTLQEAGPLPQYVHQRLEEGANQVAELLQFSARRERS